MKWWLKTPRNKKYPLAENVKKQLNGTLCVETIAFDETLVLKYDERYHIV